MPCADKLDGVAHRRRLGLRVARDERRRPGRDLNDGDIVNQGRAVAARRSPLTKLSASSAADAANTSLNTSR